MTATEPEVDGRVLRGRRNREAIVDSLLALYAQGHIRPTAAMVAEAAGLSTRSVYHHFDDMKSLILEVSARSDERWRAATTAPEPTLELGERTEAFAVHRVTRWCISAPVVRAGLLAEQRSRTVERLMRTGREQDGREIRTAFADVIDASTHPDRMVAALDVAFDFHTWERLQSWSRLDERATVEVIVQMANAALMQR